MSAVKDWPPFPAAAEFLSDAVQNWMTRLGIRQNIDMLNTVAPAVGDEIRFFDISATGDVKEGKTTFATAFALGVTEGTWTPVDVSGASLTLSNASGFYQKIGNWVHYTARFDYPVTASGATASIGGLPYTIKNSSGARTGSLTQHNGAFATKAVAVENGTAMVFTDNTSSANATNVQMSNTISWVAGSYRIEP